MAVLCASDEAMFILEISGSEVEEAPAFIRSWSRGRAEVQDA